MLSIRLNQSRLMSLLVALLALAANSLGCAHAQLKQQSERKTYIISSDSRGVGSDVKGGIGGAGAEAYCNQAQIAHYDKCINSRPSSYSVKKGSAVHHELCTREARQEFERCVKELEEAEQQEAESRKPSRKQEFHFQDIDTALVWLKAHKTEVALGALVIVGVGVGAALAAPAAVAFVVGLSEEGALVLVPASAMQLGR